MTALGTITLWLTGLLACWSVAVGVAGRSLRSPELLESSRRAAIAPAALLAVAVFCLAVALARHDFNVAYVADHTSRNIDLPLALAALTAGGNGMLLSVLFAFGLIGATFLRPAGNRMPMVLSVSALILSGVVILLVQESPFARLGVTPLDGRGLDPLLRAPVTLERPLALLGYASLGAAVVGLAGRRPALAGRWLVVTWILLAAALTAGLWNAYRFGDASGAVRWGTERWGTLGIWIAVGAARLVRWRVTRLSPAVIALVSGGLCIAAGGFAARRGPVRDFRIKAGKTATIPAAFGTEFSLTHMGISRFQSTDRVTAAATLDVDRGDRAIGLITSERRQYFGLLGQPVGDPVTGIGIHRGPLQDIRAIFRQAATDEEAEYHIRVVPLMSLIWLGAALLLISGVLSLMELE